MGVVTFGREEAFRQRIADLTRLQPGESVLDVGCGTGTLAMVAWQRVGETGHVSGIDPSPQMITRANRKAVRRDLAIDFQVGVIDQLSFPDLSFDVVLSTSMMHRLPFFFHRCRRVVFGAEIKDHTSRVRLVCAYHRRDDATDGGFHAGMTAYWILAFVCTDKADSRESREAWGLHLLRFHLLETSVRDDGSQIWYAAPSSMKARSLTRSFLLVLEISNDQSPPRFEHTGDFSQSLTFEGSRQMMHHQGREHHIKCLIEERELLNHSNLEIDGQVASSRF